MQDVPIFTATLVLTALLPISVLALYALIKRHVQLAPDSPVASVITQRFNSLAECEAYHADFEATRQARREAVLARYGELYEEEMARIDPRDNVPPR